MSGTSSNSAFPLPPRSKNVVGNRTNIDDDVDGDEHGDEDGDDHEDLGDDFLRGLDE